MITNRLSGQKPQQFGAKLIIQPEMYAENPTAHGWTEMGMLRSSDYLDRHKNSTERARQMPQGRLMSKLEERFGPEFAKIGTDDDTVFVRKAWDYGEVVPGIDAQTELYVGGKDKKIRKYGIGGFTVESWNHFFERGLKKAKKMAQSQQDSVLHA